MIRVIFLPITKYIVDSIMSKREKHHAVPSEMLSKEFFNSAQNRRKSGRF